MNTLQLLYKYMAHLQHLEESTFIELANTAFSPIVFSSEELAMLRCLENDIRLGHNRLRVLPMLVKQTNG